MIIKTEAELYQLVRNIILTAGADERNANDLAEHLVSSNLSGVDTHGIWHLPRYVESAKSGEIVPTAWPEVLRETSTSALVTGNWTFGQVAAKYAMQVAIAKAKEHGIAVVSLVQSDHIGRLGFYVEMAASEGMISMVWAGGYSEEEPATVPYGGRKPVLHTNPLAMGFPAGEEPRMMFDFATAAVSGVKVINAQRRGERLPAGCIVDKDGVSSTDPNDFFAGGGHVPFGGHKGYALMMATEFLGRIFAGADAFADANHGGPIMRHQGVTMVVFKADLFQPFATYASRADEMARRVRAIPPAPGFSEVLMPGDPEVRTRAIRRRDGIPIADDVWESITEVATSLGITDI
ncbi:MAG: Ldh family oxidoreductase [Candidatus Poribacteria bacterium]|nr:Ldh family oxidoreductase [Candidatus Poribacteria bacterium]